MPGQVCRRMSDVAGAGCWLATSAAIGATRTRAQRAKSAARIRAHQAMCAASSRAQQAMSVAEPLTESGEVKLNLRFEYVQPRLRHSSPFPPPKKSALASQTETYAVQNSATCCRGRSITPVHHVWKVRPVKCELKIHMRSKILGSRLRRSGTLT